jgi:D-alanyl-D-alanine carboxypeptidase (penicillin-binding protein 5/6)
MTESIDTVLRSKKDLIKSGLIFGAGALVLTSASIAVLALETRTPVAPHSALATTTPAAPNAYQNLALTGHAAIVYDLSTGETLYAQEADQQLPLASLTKLLTMYAASGVLQDKSRVKITKTALAQDGDYGFKEGETFAFNDIARLALVASSNDAAEAIAEAAGANKQVASAQLLAGAAAAAGLSDTHATNGTGLDINTQEAGAYGTARDVAVLAGKFLQKAPLIAAATIEPSITIHSLEGASHTLPNTNQDVVHVPGILLSKTGYTDLAGGNLVVVYDAGIGHPVAVVILGSTRDGRFTDVQKLIDATGAHFAGVTTQGATTH